MDDNKKVEILIEEKIILANELANKLQTDFNKVDGAIKTKRCIDKEMKFLKRVSRKEKFLIFHNHCKDFFFLLAENKFC